MLSDAQRKDIKLAIISLKRDEEWECLVNGRLPELLLLAKSMDTEDIKAIFEEARNLSDRVIIESKPQSQRGNCDDPDFNRREENCEQGDYLSNI